MSTGVDLATIEPGMPVFGPDGAALGTVEAVQAAGIRVLHHTIPVAAIARVDADGVHLLLARAAFETTGFASATEAGADMATASRGEQIIVQLAEERLTVGTREVDLGEVLIRKRVITEERLVPAVYRREEVEIVQREAGQPWPAGVDETEQGIEITRIALRGAEPTVDLQQVVSREVVISKGRIAEERQIIGTVRREHVEVEQRYRQARAQLQEQFAVRQARNPDGRTFAEAEPQYRAGFSAANDLRYDGRDFAAVEDDVRRDHDAGDRGDGDGWVQLREEIREGWDAARAR